MKSLIKITTFINPHMFWFIYDPSVHSNTKLIDLERKIQNYFTEIGHKHNNVREPAVGEIVAFFNHQWQRWIRAEVDYIADFVTSEKKFVLWAIDHGVAFSCEAKWLRALPLEFAEAKNESVHFAGINNIIPAEQLYNLLYQTTILTPVTKWSVSAVEKIEKIINDAATISFECEMKTREGQLFGNLEIRTHTNETINASSQLLELDQGKKTNDILNILTVIGTNKIPRWQKNDGSTKVFNSNMNQLKYDMNKYVPKKVKSKLNIETVINVSECERNEESKLQKKTNTEYDEQNLIQDIELDYDISRNLSGKIDNFSPNSTSSNKNDSLFRFGSFNEHVDGYNNNGYDSNIENDNSFHGSLRSALKQRKAENKKCKPPIPKGDCDYIFDNEILEHVDNNNTESESTSCEVNAIKMCLNRLAIAREKAEARIKTKVKTKSESDFISKPEYTSKLDNSFENKLESKLNNLSETKFENTSESEVKKKLNTYSLHIPNTKILPAGFNLANLNKVAAIPKNIGIKKSEKSPNFPVKQIISKERKTFDITSKEPLRDIKEKCLQLNYSKQLVLLHGNNNIKPITNLHNANFSEEVFKGLSEMRLDQVFRIQEFTWPSIMRGNSMIIINGRRTGKTIAYLPAVCSLTKMKLEENLINDAVGPICIIIVLSSAEVVKISNICHIFFKKTKNFSIVEAYGYKNLTKAEILLLNGCDILIATIPGLVRLLDKDIKLFDSKRIEHLVFDNIDNMFNLWKSEMLRILSKFCVINEKQRSHNKQLIFTSEKWCSWFDSLLKYCKQPQICIGAYLEAAVYSKLQMILKIVKKETKVNIVLDFLKEHCYTKEKTIIICANDKEVDELFNNLNLASISAMPVFSESPYDEIVVVSDKIRRANEHSVLICIDKILPELDIRNGQNIIHYSLSNTWSRFTYRFSVCFDYFNEIIKDKTLVKPKPISLVLVDEGNNLQLPKLIEFLQEHKCDDISPEILSLCYKIKLSNEDKKIKEQVEVCPALLELGKCVNKSDCGKRHNFTKNDVSSEDFPTNGTVKVDVLNVITPSVYTVRILEHRSNEENASWKKFKLTENYLKFCLEFLNYFNDTNNHQIYWPVNINGICVVYDQRSYHRCKVLSMPKIKKGIINTQFKLTVYLLDAGRNLFCSSSNLLVIPDQFLECPFQANYMRLLGIAPQDFEDKWDIDAIESVENWLKTNKKPEFHIAASVKFSLLNTIWVENIILLEELPSISTYKYVKNIKKSLIDEQYAYVSDFAYNQIKELASQCGIEISVNTTPSDTSINLVKEIPKICEDIEVKKHEQKRKQKLKEKWAILPENEFTRVSLSVFHSPNDFYLQAVEQIERHEALYKKINKFISENSSKLNEPEIGLNCLAKYDDKFIRAKIIKIMCNEDEIQVELFFCDIGIFDTKKISEIRSSCKEIVEFLPFQAIHCKFVGIKPLDNSTTWGINVCNSIYDEILDSSFYMYARPTEKFKKYFQPPLFYPEHDVILLDCSTELDIILNRKIVEKGFAQFDPDTNHYLELIFNSNIECSAEDLSDLDDLQYQTPKLAENVSNEEVEFDVTYSLEDAIKMFNLPPNTKILPPLSENQIESHLTEIIEIPSSGVTPDVVSPKKREYNKTFDYIQNLVANTEQSNGLEEYSTYNSKEFENMRPLLYLYKIPNVLWKQTISNIFLSISATDVRDYYLKVTNQSLIFNSKFDDHEEVLVINFLGCVKPEFTAHQIKGLKVVVRLVKSIKGLHWPRLTLESDRLFWLQPNLEAINVEDPKMYKWGTDNLNENPMRSSSSMDSLNSDIDYNQMINDDIKYDPLEDEFLSY